MLKPGYSLQGAWAAIAASIVLGAIPLAAAEFPVYSHIVIVEYENKESDQILGSAQCPYITQLSQQGAMFTNFYAEQHPSEPNYLDLFSGSNQGVNDDGNYSSPPWTTPNLGAQLLAKGYTFGGYSESLPSVGYTGSTWTYDFFLNEYVEKHNPWVNWQGTGPNQIPAATNMPYTSSPIYNSGNSATYDYSSLPTLSYIAPNEQNDMHDGTLQQGDQWLQNNMNGYIQWAKTHNSLLVFTFDEDDSGGSTSQESVPTFIVGQGIIPGVYNEAVDHFSLLRTIEDMYGLPYAGAAATAIPITDIFAASAGTRATTTWQLSNSSGNWSGSGNWGAGVQYPNANTFKVSLNLASTTTTAPPSSVNINVDVADARCEYLGFDQVSGIISNYTVSGVNPLTIEAGSYAPYGALLGAVVVPAGNTGANAIFAPLRISTNSDTAGLVIDNNGTGGLTISGPITYDGSGGTLGRSLLVQGSGMTTIAGSIDGGVVATLTKAGAGTLYLTNIATYRGATTINAGTLRVSGAGAIPASSSIVVNGGTFLLDNSAGYAANRVANSAGVTLDGGTFALLGNTSIASSAAVGPLTLGPGVSTIAVSRGTNSSYNAALTLGSGSALSGLLTRTAGSGSMLNFTAQTTGQGGPGGTYGGGDLVLFGAAGTIGMPAAWLVVNGHDFARYDSTQGICEMANLGAPRYTDLGAAPANSNVLINGFTQTSVTASKTINSLVVQLAGSQASSLGAGVTLNIANSGTGALDSNGGILVSGPNDFGANGGYAINGGTITSGAAGSNSELFTWIDSGTTAINSVIADSGGGGATALVLGGTGTLQLGGANTFSGGTIVNSGVLQPSGANVLGPVGSSVTIRAGGALDINGQALSGSMYQVSVAGAGGGCGAIINSGSTQSSALQSITLAGDAVFGGANEWDLRAVNGGTAMLIGNGFSISKTGSSTIAIAAASVTGVQNININQGTLALTYNTAVDNATPGSIAVNSGATLSVGNWGATPGVSITKPLMMSGGTLQTDDASNNGNATIAANISLNAMPTLDDSEQLCPIPSMAAANICAQAGSTLTLSGIISNGATSNSLLLCGSGTVVIAGTGANTYGGDTIVNAGILNVQKSQGLGTGSVSVAAGAELQLQGNVTLSSPMLAIGGRGYTGNTGALHNISGNNVWTGNISLAYGALTGSTTPGANVYTPLSTAIMSDAGTLTINGNIVGTTNSGDRIILGGAGNGVINGVISGAQWLFKSTATVGTWTLNGADSFSGVTEVDNGQFLLGNTNALQNSTYTGGLNNGLAFMAGIGTFNLGGLSDTAVAGTTAINNAGRDSLSLADTAGGGIILQVGNNGGNTAYSGVLSGAGGLTKVGAGLLTLSGSSTYTGGTIVSAGTLQLGNGSSTNGSVAGSVALNGGVLKLDYSAPNYNVNGSIALTADSTVGNIGNSQAGFGGGPLLGNGHTLTVDNGGSTADLFFNQSFGSALGLINIVNGIAAEDGSQGMPLQGAAIAISNGAAFATLGSPVVNNSFTLNGGAGPDGNGAIQNQGNGTAVYSGTISLNGGNSTIGTAAGNITISGQLSGPGAVTLAGGNTLTLSASNTYFGSTTILAGALQVGNGGSGASIGSTSGVTDNASLIFNHSDVVTFNPVISGNGGLTQTGSGMLILTNTNSYSGPTTISAGTLEVGAGGSFASIGNTSGVLDNGSLVFNHNDAVTFSAAIGGSGSLMQTGPGILTVTGNNAYTGQTAVSAGTLRVGSGGTAGNLPGSVAVGSAGTLVLNRSDTLTMNNTLSGPGAVVKMAGDTVTLAGNLIGFAGPITAAQGQLVLASPAAPAATSAYTANSGATLTFQNTAFPMNLNSISAMSGGTVQYSNATISNAFLFGSSFGSSAGVHVLSASTSNAFIDVTINAGTPVQVGQNGSALLSNVTNYGAITAASGGLVLAGGQNDGGGTLMLGGTNSDSNWGNWGTVVILGGGLLNNRDSNLTSWGGQISINSGGTLNADSAAQGAALNLQDSLLVNNGTVIGTTNVVYGATVTGSGAFDLLDLSYGGTLDLISQNANLAALAGFGTVNHGGINGNTLTVGSGAFAGTIENNGGTLALLKIGGGELILSGANSYTGGTNVEAGTLDIASDTALPPDSSLTLGASGTLVFDSTAAAGQLQGSAIEASAAQVVAVPEPGTAALLIAAAALLAIYRKRR